MYTQVEGQNFTVGLESDPAWPFPNFESKGIDILVSVISGGNVLEALLRSTTVLNTSAKGMFLKETGALEEA